MRVKINGVLTERELEIIIGCGADEVGIFIGQQYASPFFILPSTAARLVKMLPPGICPVMDTHITDHHELLSLMERSGIYTVQLHCWKQDEVLKLRERLPHYAKILLNLFPASPNFNHEDITLCNQIADGISVDCFNYEPGNNSGSYGFPDWEAATGISGSLNAPWWLNGGLCAENVGNAIQKIGPFGVEADILLRQDGILNAEQCRKFVTMAKNNGSN